MHYCTQKTDTKSIRLSHPWDHIVRQDSVIQPICSRYRLDGLMLATMNLNGPKRDEFLYATPGLDHDVVRRWLLALPESDRLFQQAKLSGFAQGPLQNFPWNPLQNQPASGAVGYYLAPASYDGDATWFLATYRNEGEFTRNECQTFRRLIHQWSCSFNSPEEWGAVRFIVGSDDRMVIIDPFGEQLLIDEGIAHEELVRKLREVILQRWPRLKPDEPHDIAMKIGNRSWWVCFHRKNHLSVVDGANWCFEMHPLVEGEMTTIGLVEDGRVAQALAYIHDHYCTAPNLEEVASSIGISLFHFHRLFSQHVGVTPKQYILQKQIQVARYLLRSRRMPVSHVAEATGFASHGHFTSTFSRIVGLNPTTYREHVCV